jgi:hypothetical protein
LNVFAEFVAATDCHRRTSWYPLPSQHSLERWARELQLGITTGNWEVDMDDQQSAVSDVVDDVAVEQTDPEEALRLDEASQPYVGRWNRLVSTSNWEKGRIISQWREALIADDAAATEFSDEAWSRRVGGVTGQHVGRLRRVYQRFGQVYETYESLFWTHFQAAADWDDAEMWLEGSVQNGWSVSQMRRQRWEALGAPAGEEPDEADVVASELDEDFEPALNQSPVEHSLSAVDGHEGPLHEGPDFGDESEGDYGEDGGNIYSEQADQAADFVQPFENLGELPEDVMDAFEAYKLAILHHKGEKWSKVPLEDLLASLDALKALAVAPSAEAAPF